MVYRHAPCQIDSQCRKRRLTGRSTCRSTPTLAFMRLLLLLALVGLGVWGVTRHQESTSFHGHAVAVAAAGKISCVPRRYFNAHDAQQFTALRNQNGSIRPVTPGRLELTGFLPQLEGYTESLYSEFVRNQYDRRKMPATWVRIEILGEDSARFLAEFDRTRASSYVPVGSGVWRKRPDCVGKTAGAGAATRVQQGPECVNWELREVNTSSGPAWLACYPAPSSDRCDMATPQEVDGVHYLYDFPISQLQSWSSIDNVVRTRVRSWRDSGRVVAFDAADTSVDRACDWA